MHTIRTRRLLREIVGPDTGKMTHTDRETVIPISLVVGVAVVILLTTACQQIDGKTSAAAVLQPEAVVQAITAVHDSSWISQAHAVAVKNGSDGAVSDLSF
jgi:hypothetical protein